MKENWQLLDYIDSCNKCCKAALESIPICLFILIVLLALIGLWYLLVLIGLKELMINFAQLMINTNDPSIALANWMTAIVSLFALWKAWKAYKESQIMRKSSAFSTLFAQLINNHNIIYRDDRHKETLLKNSKDAVNGFSINKDNDVFTSMYIYFVSQQNSICSDNNVGEKLTSNWNDFVNSLIHSASFSNCFKYVHYEVKTVLLSPICEKPEKAHYLNIIQANMSHTVLFAYFLNLIQHYIKDDNFRKNSYLESLRKNDFFDEFIVHKRARNFICCLYTSAKSKDVKLQEIIDSIIDIKKFQRLSTDQ